MKICNVIIGNSSSGILESPSLKIPTINIGSRQDGRIFSKNIVNSNGSYESIYRSIKKSFFKKNFSKKIKNVKNPLFKKKYFYKNKKIIEQKILKEKIKKKIFYDIK